MLEFDKVCQRLAGFTSFPPSRSLALALTPSYVYAEVARRLAFSRDALRLLELRAHLPLDRARDVRPAVQAAALGGQLSGPELLEVADTLAVLHSAAGTLRRLQEAAPALAAIASGIGDARAVERELRRALDLQGQVVDGASELLGRLRHEHREAQERLLARLNAIVASPAGRRVLQEPFITTRGDRHVLAVRAEHRGQFPGLIHDISSSGATVFMEPLEMVEMGNASRELKLGEEAEVQRVLKDLSALVGAHSHAIHEGIERLAQIGLALAMARYASSLGAAVPEVAEPKAGNGPPPLVLIDARHPLLEGNVVPISVTLGAEARALVISGPNTGGKTVALKVIGLLAAMAQAGLPIPAAGGSRLPVFDGIFADIGDEQSIQQSLSTFSAHMSTIVDVLDDATRNSLVLLDELGAGTDPQEGSAMGVAILSSLLRRGASAVVTTHHSALKTFASSTPGALNASVEFDAQTLAPTFRLIVGLPGRSNALIIAERLGLPEEVLGEARAALGSTAAQVEALLADIQRQRDLAASERAEAERLRRSMEEAQAALARQAQALEEEQRRSTLEQRVEIQVMAEGMKSRLRRGARRLDALLSEQERRELAALTAEAGGIGRQLRDEPWKAVASTTPAQEGTLVPGDVVRVEGMTPTAQVLAGPDRHERVELQAGAMRISLPRERVHGPVPGPPAREAPPVSIPKAAASWAQVGQQLSVHGMRAHLAVAAVDEYLEKAAMAGHPRVRIVHGKGRGILRSAIHGALKEHPLVKGFREGADDEGGQGITIVDL